MSNETEIIEELIDEKYIPSAIERKKAVLMYFFIGIVASLSQDTRSIYESFHLRQAIGWWTLIFIGLVLGIGFVFIPYAWVIPVFFFLCFLVIRIVFVKQAYEWRFTINQDKILMPLFASFGWWIMEIFSEEKNSFW